MQMVSSDDDDGDDGLPFDPKTARQAGAPAFGIYR